MAENDLTPEMVKRVAQAIDTAMGLTEKAQEMTGFARGMTLASLRVELPRLAREVISATREPTEEMLARATGFLGDGAGYDSADSVARAIWGAMIDAALGK